jgi:thioredoxin reductase (NADPH)
LSAPRDEYDDHEDHGDSPGRVGVIGGGAAGVSAATWLRSLHVEVVWWAGARPVGGLLERVNNPIANFPPRRWSDGRDLARALRENVAESSLEPLVDDVDRVERADRGFGIHAGGAVTWVDAVIVATGTRYRQLGVPGEAEGLGTYVSQSAARDAPKFDGQTVMVVGGGDAAFENALRLAEAGAEVLLAARSQAFRARYNYVERVQANPAIRTLPIPTIVNALQPSPTGCVAHCTSDGEEVDYDVACVFVRIGVAPVVPNLPDAVSLDDRGFIVVDRTGASSVPGIFAAGDVTDTNLRSVATSMGDGARCARSAAEFIGTFFDS